MTLKKSKTNIGSSRNFGLFFFAVFLVLSLWPKVNDGKINIWLLGISLIFLILGLLKPKLLTPLNKLWFRFGIILGNIVSPLVMALVFFLVVTPTGLIMRVIGKDLLNKKYDKKKETYWIKRYKPIGSMKRQF